MRFAFVLTILLLSSCTTAQMASPRSQPVGPMPRAQGSPLPVQPLVDPRQQGAAALALPPTAGPSAPKAMTWDEQVQAYRKMMRQEYPDMDEQDFERHVQYGIAKQKERLQYRATKRSVFRLKFRHQYPTMSEEEIEVLVNDAVDEGLREEAPPSFGGAVISPPVSCTSSRIGSYTYTDCY